MKRKLNELLWAAAEVAWRVAVLLVLVVAGLAMWSWLVPAHAEVMWVNVGEHSHLNGRSRAVNGEIVAKLQRGWEVEVVHIRNGWALVDGYGEDGHCWVSADYLVEDPLPQLDAFEPVKVRTKVNRLLVRIGPGGRAVDRIERKGTRLTVLATVVSKNEKWAYLGDGRWVMWRYLEVDRR